MPWRRWARAGSWCAIGGDDGAEQRAAASSASCCGCIPANCWAPIPLLFSWELVADRGRRAPHLVAPCSTRSCTRRWSGSCSTRRAAARAPDAPPAADLPQRRRLVAGGEVVGAEDLQLRAARRPGGDAGAGQRTTASGTLLMVDVGGTTTDVGVRQRRRSAGRASRLVVALRADLLRARGRSRATGSAAARSSG